MLQGLYTAIVTPFKNGEVDYDAYKKIIELQIEAKVDGIVPMGTTGESPTMSTEEHLKFIKKTIEFVNKRCKVMAGTGANSTNEAIHQTLEALKMGADYSLQVTPYYNKPTQEGLYRHFSEVANVGLQIILYNVPGRTGTAISVDVIKRLSNNINVAGVKEAGGSVDRISEILSITDIAILSGDDGLTVPMMALGAKGVISVASNLYPSAIKEMVDAMNNKNYDKAVKIHYKYYQFMKDIFIETNPIPIKAAMAKAGLINEEYRLPLCQMKQETKNILYKTIDNLTDK